MSDWVHVWAVLAVSMLLEDLTAAQGRELAVSINVSYVPPPGAELGPNEYRAASGPVNVTCTAVGGTGPVSYQWSSTCRDCPFKDASYNTIIRPAVHSGDTGIHTCTATSGSLSGSETIHFNVVGAGIHVFRGASTGNLQVPRSLPNNGIVISLITTGFFFFRFFCRSDSMMSSVGMLIGPDGTTVTTGDVFTIAHLQPGELRIENKFTQNVLTASDQGVYTCRIPLQSGEMTDINVGIYPSGFNTPPSITHLGFTYGSISSTLTCISTGSPATNVTWMRDGQLLTLSGSTYQSTQTLSNRKLSTYENVLIINRATSDIIGNAYNCTVTNALGNDSRTLIAYHGQESFQIQVGPVEHCVAWNTEKATSLENAIQSALISVIENYCECTFPASNIIQGQFTCLMTQTQVTYRSTISGTADNNATQLLAVLQDWIASGPVIKLDWLLLHVSPGCPIHISSMADPECSLSEPQTFDNPTLITSDYGVIQCVNVCLRRTRGRDICGA